MGKPKTVSEYISKEPAPIRKRLIAMRKCIKAQAPGAVENIKWGMPSISYKRILVNYCAFKNHISLFPTSDAIRKFKPRLKKYKTNPGTIQFQHDEPLPLKLISAIVKYRVKAERLKDIKWKPKK